MESVKPSGNAHWCDEIDDINVEFSPDVGRIPPREQGWARGGNGFKEKRNSAAQDRFTRYKVVERVSLISNRRKSRARGRNFALTGLAFAKFALPFGSSQVESPRNRSRQVSRLALLARSHILRRPI